MCGVGGWGKSYRTKFKPSNLRLSVRVFAVFARWHTYSLL